MPQTFEHQAQIDDALRETESIGEHSRELPRIASGHQVYSVGQISTLTAGSGRRSFALAGQPIGARGGLAAQVRPAFVGLTHAAGSSSPRFLPCFMRISAILIEPELLKRVDDFCFKHRFRTRAAAIKWLLDAALKAKLAQEKGGVGERSILALYRAGARSDS